MYLKRSNRIMSRAFFNDGDGEGGGGSGGSGGDDDNKPVTYTQEQMDELTSEVGRLKAKQTELLGETKKAKEQRRQAEEDQRLADEAKHRKEGDFEQLHASGEKERERLSTELSGLRQGIATEKQTSQAMKIAADIANTSADAEILSEFIARRLKYTDDGIQVLDASGQLSIMKIDELKKEFEGNERYSSLLKGNQSSGGGAPGSGQGGGAAKTASRTEFDSMNPVQRMEFSKSGGILTD